MLYMHVAANSYICDAKTVVLESILETVLKK